MQKSDLVGWPLFWRFVRERHRVFLRRERGDDPPWTADPVLRDYFFTNVYRELDPGTRFIQSVLNDHVAAPLPDRLFNVMLYRLCLREESFEQLGWSTVGGFDADEFLAFIRDHPRPFHNAYMISNQNTAMPKDELLALTASEWAEWLPTQDMTWPDREAFIRWLGRARGIGPFLATQVLADLTYKDHVGLPEDGYVQLGGGARRGLNGVLRGLEVARKPIHVAEGRQVLDLLSAHQQDEHHDVLPYDLTRMNLQNCACEFSKYARGGGKRRYRRGSAQHEANL